MTSYSYPPAMRQLVNELSKLPSVGEKSALRLAYFLLTRERSDTQRLAEAIMAARDRTRLCDICYALTENTICSLCSDPGRRRQVICVVEKPADVLALERSGGYNGLYHVLHGLWSPLKGVSPEQTKIRELLERIRRASANPDALNPPVEELILATSTTVEGDATALYIANSVASLGIRTSRIAQGLPKGGELEFADEMTLTHAIEGRQSMG